MKLKRWLIGSSFFLVLSGYLIWDTQVRATYEPERWRKTNAGGRANMAPSLCKDTDRLHALIGKSFEEVTLEFGKADSVFTSGSPKSTEYIYGDYPVFVLKVDNKNRVSAFTCDS